MSATTTIPTPVARPCRPLHIIHVDDLRELCDIVQKSLARDGHTVEVFPDGASAVGRVREAPQAFDLFISDHHMPKMNGLEVVRELRRLGFPGKIFIFSSEIDDDVNKLYHEMRVEQVLPKPIVLSELRQLLAEL
jgi:CheY-like chemotaxis protein